MKCVCFRDQFVGKRVLQTNEGLYIFYDVVPRRVALQCFSFYGFCHLFFVSTHSGFFPFSHWLDFSLYLTFQFSSFISSYFAHFYYMPFFLISLAKLSIFVAQEDGARAPYQCLCQRNIFGDYVSLLIFTFSTIATSSLGQNTTELFAHSMLVSLYLEN